MKKKSLLLTAVATLGLTASTLAQSVPSYVPTNGLVGWWPFNGNANDESGNGNNGTVNGATLTSDRFGNANKAYSFDGIDDGIITPDGGFPYGSSDRSINLWVNDESVGSYCSIMVRYGLHAPSQGCWILHNNNCNSTQTFGNLRADFYNSGVWSGNNSMSNSNWNMISVSMQNGNCMIYLNGMLIAQGNVIANTTPANNSFYIGGDLVSIPNYFFNGKLDDIGIWDRALTQQEISDLFNGCQLSVNTQPTNQTININNSAQFVVSSSDPSATFQWQTDLGVGYQNLNSVGQYSGTTNDTLIVSNVTLSNNNQPFRCIISSGSCSDTSNVAVLTVNNNVGINETSQDKLFSVYPNPAQTVINVKADSKLIGEPFNVIDNTGRVVLSGKIASENTSIELGNLSNGVYLFQVKDNLNQSFRIVKN